MKIFSTEDIQAITRFTLKERQMPVSAFIDSVGESLSHEIISAIEPGKRLIVFAGPERNGAYALAASRHLTLQGFRPEIYLYNIGGNRATAACMEMRDRYVRECGTENFTEITSPRFSLPEIERDATLIDGLFGTERTTPFSGGYQAIVRYINECGTRVISIDVPSGMLADSVEILISRNIVHASLTLAIGLPNIAFFLKDNAELLGNWKVVPVDFSQEAIDRTPAKYRLLEKTEIRHILKPRDPFASKADCGDAMIFAGSYGMLGAAVLAARGALRAGAGKVTVHTPRCGFFVMQNSVPCALFDCDASDVAISKIELRHDYNAVAIGPGIGTADMTIDALDGFLRIANANSRPVVLDADALNCMSIRPSILNHIPVMSILTPHIGEFDRLFGSQPSSYARLLKAIDEAKKRRIIIVLKGRFTAIVWPDGKVFFNPTGSAALATGGTGDVLTGIIAAFMSQGMRPELAAVAAPYVHGLAGEMAAERFGEFGTTASDVVDFIGMGIKAVMEPLKSF